MKNKKKTKLKIGDKVECINAVPGLGTLAGSYTFPKGYLRHGKIYTVVDLYRAVMQTSNGEGSHEYLCLKLKEVPVKGKFGNERGFPRFRFKKI